MPKIYIKTDMTEMPKGCRYCQWLFLMRCTAKGDEKINTANSRPDWCPLVTEQEILEEKVR